MPLRSGAVRLQLLSDGRGGRGAEGNERGAGEDAGEEPEVIEYLKTPPDPAAPPEAQAAARKVIEDEAKGEFQGDMEFIKLVRGAGQALKDELEKAKIKGVLTLPGKFEQSDDYKEARDGLKDLDTTLDDMDQQIRHDMPPGSLMTLAA